MMTQTDNIYLIGLMGAGKTTIGRQLAKALHLPFYDSDKAIEEQTGVDIPTIFDGQDIGYIKENETRFVIPSTYNFTPLPNDKIKLEQAYLRPTNDTYPVFNVSGVEKSVNADRLFWKLKVDVEQSVTENDLNAQVLDTYVFFEYDKKIHELEDAEFLTKTLTKNETLRDRCKRELFDSNSGFYLV